MARFCAYCGTAVSEESAFCTKCGKPVAGQEPAAPEADPTRLPNQETAPHAPGAVMAFPPPGSGAPSSASGKSGSPLVKIAVGCLGLLVLAGAVAIGGCIYIGQRVRKKVEQTQRAYNNGNGTGSQAQDQSAGLSALGKLLGGLGKGSPGSGGGKVETRPIEGCSEQEQAGFATYLAAASKATIPLKEGLTLVHMWTKPEWHNRELELMVSIKNVGSNSIAVDGQALVKDGRPHRRVVCVADLLHAREFDSAFGGDAAETDPGTTMFSLSSSVFEEVKAARPAHWARTETHVQDNKLVSTQEQGLLTRVESGDVPYSVVVNGKMTRLPSIHARATLTNNQNHASVYDAWVLDDSADPIVLNLVRAADNWHITYVKIDFPIEKKIEQELAQNGRAEIYGIYFDFDSATLRAESGPVLNEIAEALKDNPGWKIKIDGHTDNVGGDAYNLQLSERRAEAVKQALIQQYGITSDRMTSEGFGASRPKATNDTAEGRALNRRVELVRE